MNPTLLVALNCLALTFTGVVVVCRLTRMRKARQLFEWAHIERTSLVLLAYGAFGNVLQFAWPYIYMLFPNKIDFTDNWYYVNTAIYFGLAGVALEVVRLKMWDAIGIVRQHKTWDGKSDRRANRRLA